MTNQTMTDAPRKKGIVSDVTREKTRLLAQRTSAVMKQLLKNPMGLIGIIILIVFIFLAPTTGTYLQTIL